MDPSKKIEILWKIISRYDHYYNATNTKATIVLAFNSIIISGLLVKIPDILQTFEIKCWIYYYAVVLIVVLALSSIISLVLSFLIINPFLSSPSKKAKHNSLIFFNHVANFENCEDYENEIKAISEERIISDLSYQVHTLAIGLRAKFNKFNWVVRVVSLFMVPSLALLFILSIVASILNQ
jgi:hypothetical protein